jgi:hypothetical protein
MNTENSQPELPHLPVVVANTPRDRRRSRPTPYVIRLDWSTLDRLDAVGKQWSYGRTTRSHIVRLSIDEGLKVLEARQRREKIDALDYAAELERRELRVKRPETSHRSKRSKRRRKK